MVAERHPGARPIEIAPILAAIPSYKEFQTGSELQTGSKQLVKDYPTLVSSGFLRLDENFGRSTEGRSIELMTVGKGKKKVMWVGTPHPNEPVGTLTIDFLSRYLCEHPEITEKLDTTFIFIKNADPDGLKLNKSWLKGGLDPLQYALGYYRPSEEKQVEWAFPVDYKTLHFHNPPPEAQALMEAFKKNKPDFYYSLHNCCFQNPYFNLSHKRTELFKPLEQVVTDQGLQLSIGKAEVPWMETYARGIYQIPSVQAKYDYFHTRGEDPLRIITGGAKSYDYLQEHVAPDSFSIESEVPYFTADALNDNTPSE
ncbi:MAG TPA: M14 family zinc carboxypeptidase, partial [Methylomirabilota bacterium]|nr:M14 family zinc carboxypeptidase [Methylomirabilota bacterium]